MIALCHEQCGEVATEGKVLSEHARRQRVKDAAVDSALGAENIVEWAPAVSTMDRARACLRQIA